MSWRVRVVVASKICQLQHPPDFIVYHRIRGSKELHSKTFLDSILNLQSYKLKMRGVQLPFLEIEWNPDQSTGNKRALSLYFFPYSCIFYVFHKLNHRLFFKSDLQIVAVGASFVSEHLSFKRFCDSEDLEWQINFVSIHSIWFSLQMKAFQSRLFWFFILQHFPPTLRNITELRVWDRWLIK